MSTPKRPSASLAVRALLVLGLSAAPALAQDTAPPAPQPTGQPAFAPQPVTYTSAADAAAAAQKFADEARKTYPKGSANIDQALWTQAAAAAEAAVLAEPGNADYLKLRAQIYTEVGFWRQAEVTWAAYFKVVPAVPGSRDAQQAGLAQYNLGYSAYVRNQPDLAARYFAECLKFDPQSAQCAGWAARTALEGGDYARAQALYAQAIALTPGDKSLKYFQGLAQKAADYGPAATGAFSRAYADLDAGRKTQALAGFQAAARSAPNFTEAWRQAGRLALDMGNAQAALEAYQGVMALPGADATDKFNLALAQEGAQYGLDAVRTFRAAYGQYTAGDKAAAQSGFQQATAQNPDYAKAWAWLGRTRYEAKNYAGAAEAYGRAVALDPNDKSSAYFLKLAQQGK
ncbi:tetratricopeptide repeat protein [Deinococcus radiopugnans]|uniref:Tetratricopeptide (TPR) repeat protein n=1 Tax=Deinococcus radiopugnans ATCC 19172 TaxID=585398 RepID=A0A5C4Y5F5_9DEIO|nr:tetratricopeptide repeat protein [Deinococcus radiopugnans]MBB6016670.1 tetratricopeptide (TPR) repeat protein [Deinococcus radiopugnans ATCC 19172]TNM70786.1 tetratricopeptide repeat protein [Deinococcus radiopugnans ATCC 19172]